MFPSLPSSVFRPNRFLPLVGVLGCLAAPGLQAASYYCDPATGSMSNPGSAASPWSTLQAVFTANKTFAAGDVIYLRNGYHGIPAVKGLNTGVVTIQPDGTATPLLSRLSFNAAKNWVVSGLDICPENAGAGTYNTTVLVSINSSSSYITVQNSNIRSANSIAGWTQQNWYDRAANGYNTYGPYSVLSNCQITNTDFSVALVKSATNSLVSHNTITNFYGDALRGLSDFTTFEYNTIMNSYIADANHDDCFQSWSTGSDGKVGTGVVYNVTVRNNLLLGLTDANQPLYNGPQGISNFDGFSENWVIENNVIFCSTYHGISLYGATNCQILNNTVMPNPLDTSGVTPWILVTEHKANADGTAWPVKSSGNLVRNNLAARAVTCAASAGTADHNIVTTAYSTYFRDYPNFDVGLIATSPAVNAGLDTGAPATDFADHARTTPYDIGAYEFLPRLYEPFAYATGRANAVTDSPSDYGFLGTNWTGTNNIVTPGLTFGGLTTAGNALQFNSNIGSDRSIDMQALPASVEKVDSDSVTRIGAPGATIWIRFLIRADAVDSAGTLTGGLNLNGAATGGTTKLSIGDTGTNANWSLNRGGTIGASTVPIVQSQVTLLVVRIAYIAGTNNDEVDLFVNPPSGANPPATPSATLRNVDIGTFDRLQFKGTRQTTVDEVSLATSWGGL